MSFNYEYMIKKQISEIFIPQFIFFLENKCIVKGLENSTLSQ